MKTFSIVPDFDVFENLLYSLFACFELFQIDKFTLDDALKRLDTRMSNPREFHPKALSEPDLNLSAYLAPIIQSQFRNSISHWTNRLGSLRATVLNQLRALLRRCLNRLYLCISHARVV